MPCARPLIQHCGRLVASHALKPVPWGPGELGFKRTWAAIPKQCSFASGSSIRRLSSMAEKFHGQSGHAYTVERVLQDKGPPFGCVYLASDGEQLFVVKQIAQAYDVRRDIYRRASGCPHVRSIVDTIPDREMLVFRYLPQNFLYIADQDLPATTIKRILKAALKGLAALHELDLVHNDVKANNIMVEISRPESGPEIQRVELIDLEDTYHMPPGMAAMGMQLGNIMWRSPEAPAMGPIQKPSDMFSFGLVCIFAMTRVLPLAVDKTKIPEGVEELAVVLERQILYFASMDGFDGLLRWLGPESAWVSVFEECLECIGDKPFKPVALWKGIDLVDEAAFKDLVTKLTDFDPRRRLTATQALEHEWFKDVDAI